MRAGARGVGTVAGLHQQPSVLANSRHAGSRVSHALAREHCGVSLAVSGVAKEIAARPQPRVAAPLARAPCHLPPAAPVLCGAGAPSRSASHSRTSHSSTGASSTPMYTSSHTLALSMRWARTPAQSSRWMRFVNFGDRPHNSHPPAPVRSSSRGRGRRCRRSAPPWRGAGSRASAALPLPGSRPRIRAARAESSRQPMRRRTRRRRRCSTRRTPGGAAPCDAPARRAVPRRPRHTRAGRHPRRGDRPRRRRPRHPRRGASFRLPGGPSRRPTPDAGEQAAGAPSGERRRPRGRPRTASGRARCRHRRNRQSGPGTIDRLAESGRVLLRRRKPGLERIRPMLHDRKPHSERRQVLAELLDLQRRPPPGSDIHRNLAAESQSTAWGPSPSSRRARCVQAAEHRLRLIPAIRRLRQSGCIPARMTVCRRTPCPRRASRLREPRRSPRR